jgi:hypothetical protein
MQLSWASWGLMQLAVSSARWRGVRTVDDVTMNLRSVCGRHFGGYAMAASMSFFGRDRFSIAFYFSYLERA